MSEVTCTEAEALLPLVADGVLRAEDDPRLFAHLADCAHCQDALAQHDLITVALRRTAPPAAPAARVVRFPWRMPLAAAAAAVVAISLWPTPSTPAPATVATATTTEALPPAIPASDDPVTVERDVAAVHGHGRKLILIRQGDQVILVDPAAPAASPRPDAVPTNFHY